MRPGPRSAATPSPAAPTATVPVTPATAVVATDGAERHLAARVDVVHPDLELVAQVDHVLDPVDAAPAAELGDVDEAVTPREDVDERAELGHVHHPAGVGLTDLGLGR